MKRLNIILCLSFMLLGLWAKAQKEISKTLEIGNAKRIELSHKYAQVKIKTWDKNYVEVKAHLDIYDDQYDIFNLSLTKQGNIINLKSDLDIENLKTPSKSVNIGKSGSNEDCDEDMHVNGVRNGYQVMVDIEVFIPKSLEINVESTYGSVKAFDISEKINIQNTYADIDIIFEGLVTGSSLKSTYSNIDVYLPKAESARIHADTGYGKIYSDLDNYKITNTSQYNFGQEAFITLGSGQKSLNLESGYQNIYIRTKAKLPRITN